MDFELYQKKCKAYFNFLACVLHDTLSVNIDKLDNIINFSSRQIDLRIYFKSFSTKNNKKIISGQLQNCCKI